MMSYEPIRHDEEFFFINLTCLILFAASFVPAKSCLKKSIPNPEDSNELQVSYSLVCCVPFRNNLHDRFQHKVNTTNILLPYFISAPHYYKERIGQKY